MDFPILPQDIQTINNQLVNYFGIDTITSQAMWRVSWSSDQNEKRKEPVYPIFKACKFVVDVVYAAMGKKSLAKYVDEEAKNPLEEQEKRINKLQEELFGDESSLLLRTVTGEAVAYTGEPKISPVKE